MALKTKSFTWGSYASKSESNAYVLELSLKENSVDHENNTSSITYKLVLKSGNNNRFSGQIVSVLQLAGMQVAAGSKEIIEDYNCSWTLLSGTADVEHESSGSLRMPIVVSIETNNDAAPPSKTLEWSWTLSDIPRQSNITMAADVTLGDACAVKWTPRSDSFTYDLRFTLGQWENTVRYIAPKKTSAYTYNGYVIPLSVAEQIPGGKSGTMTVELITYSAATVMGSHSKEITVTVPENEETVPSVSMELTTVNDFGGLCLQGRTKIQGRLAGAGRYGASIEDLTMEVCGKRYSEPWLSEALTGTGQISVIATAKDSRGFLTVQEQFLEVVPYFRPRLTANAYRCTEDGIYDASGECLKIEAAVKFASVKGTNNCTLYYRYLEQGSEIASGLTLLQENLISGEMVQSGVLLSGLVLPESAYKIQVVAVDTVGEITTSTILVPSTAVFAHKRPGGRGLGLGGYCDMDDMLDVHWNQRIRKGLIIGYGIGSVYISVTGEDPAALFGGIWERIENISVPAIYMWRQIG